MTPQPELLPFLPIGEFLSLKIEPTLIPVAQRIATVLEHSEVYKLFKSAPSATGGVSKFPYFRVDSAMTAYNGYSYLARDSFKHGDVDAFAENYSDLSRMAVSAMLWIEVGFEGIDNFAEDEMATKSWTAGGHRFAFDSDEEFKKARKEDIKTEGRKDYEKMMRDFIQLRADHPEIAEGDLIAQYKLETMLERFATKSE